MIYIKTYFFLAYFLRITRECTDAHLKTILHLPIYNLSPTPMKMASAVSP